VENRTGQPGRRWTVGAPETGVALDKFLAAADRLTSRSKAATARERGKVFVNNAEVGQDAAGLRLKAGDVVRVWDDRPGSATRRRFPFTAGDLRILYEDTDLVVLNKPAGLLAVPLERRSEEISIFDQLETHLRSHGKLKPLVVHRIDLDTSGIVLFAKNARAQAALKRQFKEHTPERVYLAVVYGRPSPPSGVWRNHLVWDTKALIQKETDRKDPRAVQAVCHYATVEVFESTSLIEVRLETGKRNQIRIQARLRGHTLVGERRYTYGPDSLRPVPFARQALHAWRLAFRHPADNRAVTFEAPLPADMKKLISQLKKSTSREQPGV
jgi:23S rRNA pseudouridine1911/1915/1917 synthase